MSFILDPFEEVQKHLGNVGIYRFTDRMEVTVHYKHICLLNGMENGTLTNTLEDLVFANVWMCAKGQREWKGRGLHCRVIKEDRSWAEQKVLSSRPCDHDHHRLVSSYYSLLMAST